MPKATFHLAGKEYTVKKHARVNAQDIAAKAALDVPLTGKRFEFMRNGIPIARLQGLLGHA